MKEEKEIRERLAGIEELWKSVIEQANTINATDAMRNETWIEALKWVLEK